MQKNRLNIIYEDKNIIVIDKKPGLLTVATNKESINTIYHQVYTYLHKKNQKVFIVHRLDKDTSGLIVFAKSEKVKQELQNNWNTFNREYIAKVHGFVDNKKDTLINYLNTDKDIVFENKKGFKTITNYEVISKTDKYSILKINILTGKKHQIRYSLSKIGHPILGDKKYGIKDNHKRLYLHANKLDITLNNKQYTFESNCNFI